MNDDDHRDAPSEDSADAEASVGPKGAVVRTEVLGQVGVITLDDERKRNALSTRMVGGIVTALTDLHAEGVRAAVLRAAAGMHVWSAGHDIDELPQGRRDPLSYNDPLEELLRAIRTFPAPVLAMVHGSVWGGAFDLVLSCDVLIADETATFAMTPVNLGLPYNIAGLLHFLGRLPVNLTKEMFFTATPIDARKAKEWLVINHLVASDELESVTLDLAATMAHEVAPGDRGHQGAAPRPHGLPACRGTRIRPHPGPASGGLRQQRLSRGAQGLRREAQAALPGHLTRPSRGPRSRRPLAPARRAQLMRAHVAHDIAGEVVHVRRSEPGGEVPAGCRRVVTVGADGDVVKRRVRLAARGERV